MRNEERSDISRDIPQGADPPPLPPRMQVEIIWTSKINKRVAELTQWALYISHYSERYTVHTHFLGNGEPGGLWCGRKRVPPCQEHGTQSLIQILTIFQSTLASGNMEHSPLSRFWPFSSLLLLPGTWNTILHPDFDRLPVYSCFWEHGKQSCIQTMLSFYTFFLPKHGTHPLSRLWSIASLLLLPGTCI